MDHSTAFSSTLPEYAAFLLNEKLDEIQQYQVQLSKEIDLPILVHLQNVPFEQLLNMGMRSLIEMLEHLSLETHDQYIDISVQRIQNDYIHGVSKTNVKAEDITHFNLLRRKTLFYFLPSFVTSTSDAVKIASDIASFFARLETRLINTHIEIFRSSLNEQLLITQKVSNTTPGILYVMDIRNYSIIYINERALQFIGYSQEEIDIMGDELFSRIVYEEDLEKVSGKAGQFKDLTENDVLIIEFRIITSDGNIRWVRNYESIFKHDEFGNVAQVIGIALDITEEKSLVDKLQESNAGLQEFAYIASHDLQEPLRKISTFGDRLLATQKGRLTQEGEIYLTKIVQSSIRMQQMINDLLSISVISNEKTFMKYDLNDILEDVLINLEYKIEEKKAYIEYDPLPEAVVIPSQMRQLFQNLISNSLKFSKPNEPLVLNIYWKYHEKCPNLLKQSKKNKKFLEISFNDNGIGIDNSYAEKIFTIFQRLHSKHEYEGTGIGLAICKKIVEHHGGIITASGQPGVGTTFTVIIPA